MTKQEQQSDQNFISALIRAQGDIAQQRKIHPAYLPHQHSLASQQQLIVWTAH